MQNFEERLMAANARIAAADAALAEDLRRVRETSRSGPSASFLESTAAPSGGQWPQPQLETIVLRVGRPVLAIVQDNPRLEFRDAESDVWRSRLTAAAESLRLGARAVGRIDVAGH